MYFGKSIIPVSCTLCALLAVSAVSATGFQQAPHVKVVNGYFYPEFNDTKTGSTNTTESPVVNTTSAAPVPATATQGAGTGVNNTTSTVQGSQTPSSLVTASTVSNSTRDVNTTPVNTSVTQGNTSVRDDRNTTAVPTPVAELTPATVSTVVQTEQGPGHETSSPEGRETTAGEIPEPTRDSSSETVPGSAVSVDDDLTLRLSGEFPLSAEGLSDFARMKAFPPLELIERLIGVSLGNSSQGTLAENDTVVEGVSILSGNETISQI
jgi:hypothetical protein